MLNNNKKQETQFFGTKCGNANSIAAGYATETTNYGEIATGILNKSTKGDNPNSPEGVVGDPKATLFSVGCGTNGERKNALEVKGDGSVIISRKDGFNVSIDDLVSEYVKSNEIYQCIKKDYDSSKRGTNSIAIDDSAKASENFATAIGNNAQATNYYSTALGANSQATGRCATVLGYGTKATGGGAIALGGFAQATGLNATVLGSSSQATDEFTTALGCNAQATGRRSIALGNGTKAIREDATALGNDTKATANYSIALGSYTEATRDYSIALGYLAEATGYGAITLGYKAGATKDNATALGHDAKATGMYSIALGYNTKATKNYSIVVGTNILETGINSMALGSNVKATGEYSIALGDSAQATGNDSIALGDSAQATGVNATAVGYGAKATADISLALGNSAQATGIASIALCGGQAIGTASIALGAGAVTSTVSKYALGGMDENKQVKFNLEEITYSQYGNKKYLIGLGGYDGTNITINNEAGEKVLNPNIKSVQEIINGKVDLTPIVTSTDATISLQPNKKYEITAGDTLVLTFTEPSDKTHKNEYLFSINTGSSISTITFPIEIIWDVEPVIAANKHYEINVQYSQDKYWGTVRTWNIPS